MGGETYEGMDMLTLVEADEIEALGLELASDANTDNRCANGYRGRK